MEKKMARIDQVVDISHHQGNPIDFTRLKEAGILGVIHKASQGAHYKDPFYSQRRRAAESAGLLWGAYHFSEDRADSGDGAAQARYFLDYVGDANGVFLSLDYESYHHQDTPEVHHNMSIVDAELFVDTIAQKIGRLPFFYSGSTIRDMLGNKKNDKLGACKLWAAGYVIESRLKIQKSWSDWTLWQYTDGKPNHRPNPIPGVGSWDRSVFDSSESQLRAQWTS
jgi:GH25 family lysozyme M1 (1,4-beta-N-acetylmuramidase)